MDQQIDGYGISLLILAAILYWRLWGPFNQPPPSDGSARKAGREENPAGHDNLLALANPAPASAASLPAGSAGERCRDTIAGPGTDLSRGLAAIAARSRTFDLEDFLEGARRAYEAIVTAYVDDDRAVLKILLSAEAYDAFVVALDEREEKGERLESTFVSIDLPRPVDAGIHGGSARITLRFASEVVRFTRDGNGVVVAGDPESVVRMKDLWTFARDANARAPDWKLIATEIG